MEEKVALTPELARQPEMNLTTFYGKVLDSRVAMTRFAWARRSIQHLRYAF